MNSPSRSRISYVVADHLRAAAAELPLEDAEIEAFGPHPRVALPERPALFTAVLRITDALLGQKGFIDYPL